MRTACLLACLLALAGTAAAGSRKLLVGGTPADQRWDPHNVDSSGVSGNMAKYTVPGTDVFVVNTGERTGGTRDEVLSNTMESQARQGDTHSYLGTITTSRVTGNLDSDARSALGNNDQQQLVQSAVSGDGSHNHIYGATQQAHGSTVVSIRGDGKTMDAENRATLAKMDASSAIQMVAGGQGGNTAHATRVGAASANAVQTPTSYYWVFVPTWWRR